MLLAARGGSTPPKPEGLLSAWRFPLGCSGKGWCKITRKSCPASKFQRVFPEICLLQLRGKPGAWSTGSKWVLVPGPRAGVKCSPAAGGARLLCRHSLPLWLLGALNRVSIFIRHLPQPPRHASTPPCRLPFPAERDIFFFFAGSGRVCPSVHPSCPAMTLPDLASCPTAEQHSGQSPEFCIFFGGGRFC